MFQCRTSRTHSTNNITCDFIANDTIQPTICINYCLHTCSHSTDIPRSQCIIFKESKYNFDNTIVVEALSNRFSTPTSAEYICKKCHKDLLQKIKPMNSVALCIKLTSHKPQQTCIHCNIVPTGKYLTFDKTKYRENTIVSQMTEKDKQNIICNMCHNAICRETLVTFLRCTKTIKKYLYIKIWCQQIHLAGTEHTRNGKITENQLLHMQNLSWRTTAKNDMCLL